MSVIDFRTRVATTPAPETTFGFAEQNGPGADAVRVDQVASNGWRVIDRRLPRGDPFRVLAYIEYCEAWYEVTQLGSVPEWHAFATLDGSVAHVLATSTLLAQERLRSSGDWSPLQPPARRGRGHLVAVPDDGTDVVGDPHSDDEPDDAPVENPSGRAVVAHRAGR